MTRDWLLKARWLIRKPFRLEVPRAFVTFGYPHPNPREDVAEWCEMAMPGRWRLRSGPSRSSMSTVEFQFLREADLVHFKLMWAEAIAQSRAYNPFYLPWSAASIAVLGRLQ